LDAVAAAKMPTLASAAGPAGATATPQSAEQKAVGGLLTAAGDTAKKTGVAARDSAKKDTAGKQVAGKQAAAKGDTTAKAADTTNLLGKPNANGIFSKAVQPAGVPGQYVVAESD